MWLALAIKLALTILGTYVIFHGILRRRFAGADGRRDVAVDRLLRLVGIVGATFAAALILGGAARVNGWPDWIGDLLDVIVAVAAVAGLIIAPVLGWKLVGEHDEDFRR